MSPRRRPWALLAAVALPPLLLAAIGTTHPSDLDGSTAEYWRDLHIGTLAIFPLLGFAPWLLVRGRKRSVSWIVGVLAFGYGAFYTALDVLSGIGAGGLEHDGMHEATSTVFRLGSVLGDIGAFAYIAACLAAAIVAQVWWGVRTIPGALFVLAGSVLFLERHIYFPLGVLGQLFIAAGWIALVLVSRRAERAAP